MKLIFVAHLLSTLLMVGVIWIIQLVHYPLFAHVGAEEFVRYEQLHRTYISLLVMPLMLIEIGTGGLLLFAPASQIAPIWTWLGFLLILVIWGSTFFVQVPLHNQITQGYDLEAIERLVHSNWIRTIAWSLRAGIIGWLIWDKMT